MLVVEVSCAFARSVGLVNDAYLWWWNHVKARESHRGNVVEGETLHQDDELLILGFIVEKHLGRC